MSMVQTVSLAAAAAAFNMPGIVRLGGTRVRLHRPAERRGVALRAEGEEKVDAWTYVFGKPGELDRDLARMGTSRARFLRINLFALAFAFASNFLGMTSFLLGLLPDLQGLYLIPDQLTQFYPVQGWKRFRGEGTFEFIYPARWLTDQVSALSRVRESVEESACVWCVCMHTHMHVYLPACLHACMHVCMYVC